MQIKNKLIYLDSYIETEHGYELTYDVIDDQAISSVLSGEYIESKQISLNLPSVNTESLKKWKDRFIYFEIFDLQENGFINAKKGGNKKLARKLNDKYTKVNKKLSKYIVNLEYEKETNNHTNDWFYCALNVGDGESSIVIDKNKCLYMFDGGNHNQNVCNKIKETILKINKEHNQTIKTEISGFFISHADNDHFRGVIDAIENLNLSKDCFIYYNYLARFPKANWITALNKININLNNKRLKNIVKIPHKNKLQSLEYIIPSLYFKMTWPYKTSKNISKLNNYNCNDSSHCIYIGNNKNNMSINLFGDIEKKGWEKNNNLPFNDLSHPFIFKLSHHGRKSGDPIVYFSQKLRVNDYIDSQLLNKNPEYLVSSSNKVSKHQSSLASKATKTSSATNAIVYVIKSSSISKFTA